MTLNKFTYIFLIATVLAGCNKIPSDYSEVVDQQAIFKGESIDTTFISTHKGYISLYGGDTFYINSDSLRSYGYSYDCEDVPYTDQQPPVFFDLKAGDHFFVNFSEKKNNDTVIIPEFNEENIGILRTDTLADSGSACNIVYTFIALRSSKSNVAFGQYTEYNGKQKISTTRGITVCYCIDISDSVSLRSDSVSWSFLYEFWYSDSTDTSWCFNRYVMNGNTDASKIFIRGESSDTANSYCTPSPMHTDSVEVNHGRFSAVYNRLWDGNDDVPEEMVIKVVLHGTKGPDPFFYIELPKFPVY